MADPMEMSLDDIIKTNRSTRGRRGRGRGAAGQMRQPRGGSTNGNRSPFKGQAAGGRRGGARPQARGGRATASNAPIPTSGHITISNLDFQVSDGDVNELFSEFGQIKKARVHFDASGKSQGSADVVFTRYQDAVRAVQKYNGVPLDGREMRIMISSADFAQALSPQRGRSYNGRGGLQRGGQQRTGGRGGAGSGGRGGARPQGGRGRGRGRGAGRPMTKEQLDAEIDAYHTDSQPMEA